MESLKMPKSSKGAREGPSNPSSVGPTKGKKVVPIGAKGDQQVGVPTSTRRQTPAKVTMEKERIATPPQSTTLVQTSNRVVSLEVVGKETPARVIIDVSKLGGEEDLSKIKVYRLDPRMVAKALQSSHNQFWAEMGLNSFSSLDWTSTTGSTEECQRFVANSIDECTWAYRFHIDLSEASLAKIFGLPLSNLQDAPQRGGK
ncbi:unnamed protein product [Calypogeia fissa]